MDLALASGISRGLLQAVQSFNQTQNMLEEQAIKKRLANAQSLEASAKLYEVGGVNENTDRVLRQYDLPTAGLIAPRMPVYPPNERGPSSSLPGQPQQQGLLGGGQYQPESDADLMAKPRALRDEALKRRNKYFESQTPEAQASLKMKNLEIAKLERDLNEGGPKPNDSEFTSAGFAKRMAEAESVFDRLGKKGFDATTLSVAGQRKLPGLLGGAKSSEVQQQEQAERDFVSAVLRKESGAAITPAEFTYASSQYFPRPGDSPEVLEQKKINRLTVFENMKASAGKAYDRTPDLGQIEARVRGESKGKRGLIPAAESGGILARMGVENEAFASPPPPKAGHTEGGYEFLGGDPADKKNWKKVK